MSHAISTAVRTSGAALARPRPAPPRHSASESAYGLPRDPGNRAFLTLLGRTAIQPKARIGRADDRFEREADAAAEVAVRMTHGPDPGPVGLSAAGPTTIQRKCAKCEAEEEELIQRQPMSGPGPPAVESAPSPVHAGPGQLIVEDDAEQLAPNQMRKTAFLDRLHEAVCSAVDETLNGTGQSSEGCPHIDYWFTRYAGKPAAEVEGKVRRFAPGAQDASSPGEYIDIIAARVRERTAAWERTGQFPTIPAALTAVESEPDSAGAASDQNDGAAAASVSTPESVRSELGSGRPLDSSVRSRMESAFGQSFGDVRVHTGPTGARLSEQWNARAFTVGEHVAFNSGEYRPGTLAGDALLAHELAHVVQQRGGSAPGHHTSSGTPSAALEADANRSAAGAISSAWMRGRQGLANLVGSAAPRFRAGLALQRCGKNESKVEKRTITVQPVAVANNDGTSPTAIPSFTDAQDIWGKCCVDFTINATKQVDKTDYKELEAPSGCAPAAEALALANLAAINGTVISVFVPDTFKEGASVGKNVHGGGFAVDANTNNPKVFIVSGADGTVLAHELGHAMGHASCLGKSGHQPPGTVMEPSGAHDAPVAKKVARPICDNVRAFSGATGSGSSDCTQDFS